MSQSKLQLANSPLDSFIEYFLDAKPYHTKLLEIIETYRFSESMIVLMQEELLKDITVQNDPLCKLVGFGVDYDDECGYDAINCCDLFDCVTGGYGFLFDNSDVLVDAPVLELNSDDGYIKIAGNYTADKRIPILEIPTLDSVVLEGDYTSVFDRHRIFITTDVVHFEISSNDEHSIFIEGDHYDFFKNRNKFHIVGTETPYNGTYFYFNVEYNPNTNNTRFDISYSISTGVDSPLLIPNSLRGLSIVLRNINNPNTAPNYESPNIGIYQVVNHTYNSGTNRTTIQVNGDDTPFHSTSLNLNEYQVGSIQIREGVRYPRWVYLTDGVNLHDHKILYSTYDHENNETIIHLSGDLTSYNPNNLAMEFSGYFFPAGYDSSTECGIPKDANIHTGLQEHFRIEIEDF